MSRKRYTPEQIISMLREAEVALAQGQSVGQACRTLAYRSRVTIAGARNMAAFVLTRQASEGPGEGEWPSPEGDLGSDVG